MKKDNANQFEEAVEQAAQGQAASGPIARLVEMAQAAAALSAEPPPPPHGLAPGRQRFLAEARAIRAGRASQPSGWFRSPVLKLASAALVVILLLGAVAGTGRVVADSLPGHPLYGLKLTAERTRITITRSPEALARLNLTLVEVRLTEVTALVTQGEDVEEPTVTRTTQQLDAALAAANHVAESQALGYREELAASIRQQQMAIVAAAGREPGPAVQLILREMERVRQEAHAGAGDAEGEQDRLRQGTPPPEPSGMPSATRQSTPQHTDQPGQQLKNGPSAEPEPSASPTATPTDTPFGPPTGAPTSTATDGPGGTPTDRPGATPTEKPGSTPSDPQPKPTQTPGPKPSQTSEPAPTSPPGPGPTRTPEPAPTGQPGPGPSQTSEPAPTQQPGPGPSQTSEPAPTSPPGPGPGPSEQPGDGSGGKGKAP